MVIRTLISVVFLWMALSSQGWGQDVDLRISGRDLQVGQVAQLQVVMTNERPDGVPQIQIPGSGLNVQFLGQSSQVNSINGRTTRLYAFNYRLEALASGQFQVGPATVRVGGQTKKSRTVSLKVTKRVRMAADLLEVYSQWEPAEVWVGQVVTYKRGLRSRRPIGQDNWSGLPEKGVALLSDAKPQYVEYTISDPDGDISVKEEMHPRLAVTPGAHKSAPAVARVEIVVGRVGQGLFSRYKTRNEVLTVPETSLTVKSLPPPPAGFSGLVGEFTVQSKVEKTEATVGASIPWMIEIEGQGSLEGFDWKLDKDQKGARVYDATPTIQSGIIDGQYMSRARFEQVIVPTEPGTLNLPAAKLVTFSPTKGEYVTHPLDVPPIQIEQGVAQDGTLTSFVGQLTRPEDFVQEPTYEGVRPPYESGSASRVNWGPWLGWMALVCAMPMWIWLGLTVMAWVRDWWARRLAAQAPKEASVATLLARLPSPGESRWSALDSLLQRCVERIGARCSDDQERRIEQLLAELHGVRFGGKPPYAQLEAEVIALIRELDGLKREAS